jgi:4-amino-4-deoxy-L-arabinose transferase-like glycosyltransferase
MNRKSVWKSIFLIFFLIILYGLSRIWGLRNLPMFIDEAIHARWAQQGFYDPAFRLVSLGDGKQPLYIWFVSLMMNVAGNPLTAGRLASIISGLLTLVGLYLVAVELFKKRIVGILAVILYILFPLALLMNRMVLFDSLVGAFTIWSLYFEILLVRYVKLDIAYTLSLILGGSLLTKSMGLINFYLIPLSLLAVNQKPKIKINLIIKYIVYIIFSVILANIYASVMKLSPNAGFVTQKNEVFIYPLKELLSAGIFKVFINNAQTMIRWLLIYLDPIIMFVVVVGLISKVYRREKLLLFLWFMIPICGLTVFGRSLNTRYILFMILPLFPLIAQTITEEIKTNLFQKSLKFAFIISLIYMLYADYKILADLPRAPIPREDLFQYVSGWPAGGGVKEIIAYLKTQSDKGPIYVVSEGTYGSLPGTAVEIYFSHNTNVEKLGVGDMTKPIPKELPEIAKIKPVYIITNVTQKKPDWPMDLIKEYQKGNGNYYLRLYKLNIINNK